MLEKLFLLLNSLIEKQEKLNDIIYILNGDLNGELLWDEKETILSLIVKELGGNQEHFNYINSGDVFLDYATGGLSELELIEHIQEVIEENNISLKKDIVKKYKK